jgi:hypothetical protein
LLGPAASTSASADGPASAAGPALLWGEGTGLLGHERRGNRREGGEIPGVPVSFG